MRAFFTEFFHPDRLQGDQFSGSTSVVILGPTEPPEERVHLLLNPVIESRVRYIKGSIMLEEDLWRVAAKQADACFVLIDKIADDSDGVVRIVTNELIV